MNISKEDAEIRIYTEEIVETLDAAGNPPKSTHEIVLPKCWVYNSWVHDRDRVYEAGFAVCFEASRVIEGQVKLFGYSVRYDQNTHALDILPKRVEEPLPFE